VIEDHGWPNQHHQETKFDLALVVPRDLFVEEEEAVRMGTSVLPILGITKSVAV
jgi:hypothetical protein